MIKLAFVFKHSPYGSSISREALDVVLAASAFCDENEIALFFIDDGVLNLLPAQQSDLILQKDISHPLKLLDLYEIKQRYICQHSWQNLGLARLEPLLEVNFCERAQIMKLLRQSEKIQVF